MPKILSLLPWADWLVLVFFGVIWIGYAQFASRWSLQRPSILAATNRFQATLDQGVSARETQSLGWHHHPNPVQHACFFLSSATIIIMGGSPRAPGHHRQGC
jgi:uncharacterized membrane protein